jgi:hypothetical protein
VLLLSFSIFRRKLPLAYQLEALKHLRHLRAFEDFTASIDEFASRTTVEPYLVTDK